ncbi:hypothetical protein EDD27_0429 [Nonomuraea polychroma]|uniref:Uncharacterized protein n=1 Tax=Nonomuraea polychroma TaxID=46176 RepID=A0A438LXA7_9ACTN|nr:hypothetical protein [Nonomuraea polychroma]RVX38136.1 hypothetical protein EDD27_0429 [Nonomuraea polychroma]
MSVPESDITAPKSVTLRRRLIAEVEELSGPRGFSAATDEALSFWVARKRLRRAIDSYEEDTTEITEAEMEAVVAKVGGL